MAVLTNKKTVDGIEFNLKIDLFGSMMIAVVNVVGKQGTGFQLNSGYEGLESVKSLLSKIHTKMEHIAEGLNGWKSAIEHLENEGFEKVEE
jgi:hypothetical protein